MPEDGKYWDKEEYVERATLYERMCNFYDTYSPDIFCTMGNGHVNKLSHIYADEEPALWCALYAKYGVSEAAQIWHTCDLDEDEDYTAEELDAIHAARAAEVAANATRGKRNGKPTLQSLGSSTMRLEARLRLVFASVDAANAEDAKVLAAMYHDEVAKLRAVLQAKYGVDIMDAAYTPHIDVMINALHFTAALQVAGAARTAKKRTRPFALVLRARLLRKKQSAAVAPATRTRTRRGGVTLDAEQLAVIESTFSAEAIAREKELFLEKSKRKRMLERRLARRKKKAAGGLASPSTDTAAVSDAADDETHAQIDLLTEEAAQAQVEAKRQLEASRKVCLERLAKRRKIKLDSI